MNRILVLGLVLLLSIGSLTSLYFYNNQESVQSDNKYQGPVRPTDDESYFRLTGRTVPVEGVVNG